MESTGEWITLKVATSAIKTINKNGLEAAIADAKQHGTYRAKV
jgi:large subunit ribosomal protein L28